MYDSWDFISNLIMLCIIMQAFGSIFDENRPVKPYITYLNMITAVVLGKFIVYIISLF